jgi:hypothetical protein
MRRHRNNFAGPSRLLEAPCATRTRPPSLPPTHPSPHPPRQIEHYSYVDGMPALLRRLRSAGYALHAMSNYPEWWRHIEAKLRVSDLMQWSFISCEGPMKVWGWGIGRGAPRDSAASVVVPSACFVSVERGGCAGAHICTRVCVLCVRVCVRRVQVRGRVLCACICVRVKLQN